LARGYEMGPSSHTGEMYGGDDGGGGQGTTTKLGSLRLSPEDECPEEQRHKPTVHTHYNSSNFSEDTQRTGECGDDPRQDASTSSSRQQKSPDALACLQVCEALLRQKRIDECVQKIEQEYSLSFDPDALFLQALCCLERNQRAKCLGLLGQALAYHPSHVHSITTYAEIQKDVGNFGAALEMIEKAHRIVVERVGHGDEVEKTVKRAYAGILVEAGTSEKLHTGGKGSVGQLSSWEKKYLEAREVCPDFAPAHYNLGVAASEAGDVDSALEYYRQATEIHPEYVEALCNMGVILQHQGKLEEAIEAHEKAYLCASSITSPESSEIAGMIAKNLAMALNHRGTQIKMAGPNRAGGKEGKDVDDHTHDEEDEVHVRLALSFYERAVAVSPCCAEALYNLGVAYAERGEVDKAIFAYRSAIKENPKCAEAHNNLGVLYRTKGLMGLALHSYEAAVQAQPTFPQALNNLAVMYTLQGRATEALDLLRAAIVVDPGYGEAWNNMGVLQRDVGEAEDAIESYKKCVALGSREDEKGHRNAGQNLLLGLNYIYDGNARVICDAHLEWGRMFQTSFPKMQQVPQRRNHPKIRVGYVSPDLFVHSVSYFAEAPIKSHNMDEFHVTVYSVCPNPDAKTRRLRGEVQAAGGIWKDVPQLNEAQLAKLVRDDEIDILIDLTGHTANNRLGTFAMKPAPVQVTWIGYPNTTGLTTMDYRITDALCDPEDTSQVFSERLIRLDDCFLCYTPCPEAPDVAPLPADSNGYITFGSFNALAKQTPEVLGTWAEILKAVPGARLVLKNKPFASDPVRQKFWKAFEQLGVDRSRVDLLPLAPKTASHLQQYSMIDICLDPFPYAGTTTTMEAMYMGVPCLTMRGRGHAHNVGVSLVTNVGLRGDTWIAEDKGEYVIKAVRAANDVAGLRQVRRGLRTRVAESAICDVRSFMNDFENRLKSL
jgi:protein O-GlcNAc transferase